VSKGRALDEKRENDESDRLNADSAKEVTRVGIHRGEAARECKERDSKE